MRGNAEALAKGRETKNANAALRRDARLSAGVITTNDAKWLKRHGQEIPEGVRVDRKLPTKEPKQKTTVERALVKSLEAQLGTLSTRRHRWSEERIKPADVPRETQHWYGSRAPDAKPGEVVVAVEREILTGVKHGPVIFAQRQPPTFDLSETPRLVVPGEVDELLVWGLPHFAVCFPEATRDNIRPMLMLACNGAPAYFIRTKNVVGLFAFERTPWNPLGTVHKVFVVAKESAPLEVLAVYEAGCRWGAACGAKWYHYEECAGYPIAPIAERIGYDATRVTYSKRLK
jgi:hypothetical protein